MVARGLLLLALPLTLAVIVFGAYVRLTDAGLGCPDWPGCYGKLIGVADAQAAANAYPDSEYDLKKAWIEVGHRYIAGLLGLLLLAAAIADFAARRRASGVLLLPPVVAFQAFLGMLTVTEKLKPVIVTSHLLGGMLILALIAAQVSKKRLSVLLGQLQLWSLQAWWRWVAALLAVQIALGGWVSTNYAGLACPDFPTCQGGWTPPTLDFSGFAPMRDLHELADGVPVTQAALATIQWAHRLMALALTLAVAGFVRRLLQFGARPEALWLAALLALQLALGIINVIWQLPLWAAVAHNAAAALLVANLAIIGVKLRR